MSCCRGQSLLEGDWAVAIASSVYSHDKPNFLTARQHCSEVNFISNVFFVMCVYIGVSKRLVIVQSLALAKQRVTKSARQVQLVDSVSLFSLNFFKCNICLMTETLKSTFKHKYERCHNNKSFLAQIGWMVVESLGQVFPCWKDKSCPVEHTYIKKKINMMHCYLVFLRQMANCCTAVLSKNGGTAHTFESAWDSIKVSNALSETLVQLWFFVVVWCWWGPLFES